MLNKNHLLKAVEAKASARAAELAHALIRAESIDREGIAAGLEFERWLAESCRTALAGSRPTRSRSS